MVGNETVGGAEVTGGGAERSPTALPPGRASAAPARLTGRRTVPAAAAGRRALTAPGRVLLLDAWMRSQLPASEFAALVGLSAATLYQWRKRFEARGPADLEDGPRGRKGARRLAEPIRRAIVMLKRAHPDWGRTASTTCSCAARGTGRARGRWRWCSRRRGTWWRRRRRCPSRWPPSPAPDPPPNPGHPRSEMTKFRGAGDSVDVGDVAELVRETGTLRTRYPDRRGGERTLAPPRGTSSVPGWAPGLDSTSRSLGNWTGCAVEAPVLRTGACRGAVTAEGEASQARGGEGTRRGCTAARPGRSRRPPRSRPGRAEGRSRRPSARGGGRGTGGRRARVPAPRAR